MTRSTLEGVPGLGPARRTRLLREIGSLRALRAASLEDLRALPWLPDAVAMAVHAHLQTLPPRPRVPGSVTRLGPALGQDGSRTPTGAGDDGAGAGEPGVRTDGT